MRVPLGRALLAAVFPERCALCGEAVAAGEGWCRRCRASAPRLKGDVRVGRRAFARCVAPFCYGGAARSGVLRLKEARYGYGAALLGREMAAAVRAGYAGVAFDCVSFVPMTAADYAARGYNQSEALARGLGRELGLPVRALLRKGYETRPQKTLEALYRSGNVLGAFDVAADGAVAGLTVLLADDLVTTGDTLHECAKMLRIHGAAAVYAVAAAAADDGTEEETAVTS